MVSTAAAAATIYSVSHWLNYLGAIPMITFGIIGALLTILVFTEKRSFRRNPTIIYLLACAIMTAIHLPTIYLQSILVDGFGLGVYNTNDIACREHNYLLYVTTVPTILFPCWAAFDQYAGTSRDANFRNRWSSMRVVRIAIISTILFWVIVYIPMFIYSAAVNGSCVLTDVSYARFSDLFLTPLVYAVGPLCLIALFTWGTVRNLRATAFVSRNDRLAKQIREMLTSQLVVLAISGIPFGFQTIYLNSTSQIEKSEVRLAIENLFVQIIRLFYHCNFVCPFYIYWYKSNEVRKVLKILACKLFRMNLNQVEPITVTFHATNNTVKTERISS